MKVLMVSTSYPNEENPTRGIFVYNLVDSLRKQAIDVKVLSSQRYNSLTGGAGILPNLKNNFKAKIIFPFYVLNLFFSIIKESKKCDLIHANWGLTAFLAILGKPFHRKKIILTERSSQLIFIKNRFLKFLLRFTYNHVNSLIVPSTFSKNEIIERYGVLDVLVIPNGAEIPQTKFGKYDLRKKFGLGANLKIAIYVGRLTSIKDLDYLLDGFSRIKFKKKFLLIVGDGELKETLKKKTELLGVDKCVLFTGNVFHKNVYEYLALADVFVFPSSMETGGNVLLEAGLLGLPILSTKVGWAEDIIEENVNGFFLKKKNARDIEKKLSRVISDAKLLSRLKRNAKKIISKKTYSWEECADLYRKQYKLLDAGFSNGHK